MENRSSMSQRERDDLKVMSAVLRGERTQAEAARFLHTSEPQVRLPQRRLNAEGDAGVVHRLKGRVSNRHLCQELRPKPLEIYQEELADFGPTTRKPAFPRGPIGLKILRRKGRFSGVLAELI